MFNMDSFPILVTDNMFELRSTRQEGTVNTATYSNKELMHMSGKVYANRVSSVEGFMVTRSETIWPRKVQKSHRSLAQ